MFGVQAAARNLLIDLRRDQQEKQRYKPIVQSSKRQWKPPPQDWVKINIDAATSMETNSTGIGNVIRNEAGEFQRARNQKIIASLLFREAEAVSLKEALSWIKNLGFKKCIFESDATVLVDACQGDRGRSYFYSIVLDCIELFKHFDDVQIEFVYRSANGVAHMLVRAACSMSDIQEWAKIAPEFISDALIVDSI